MTVKIIWGATSGALFGGILEPTKLWTFGMLVADSIVTQTLKDKCISFSQTKYDMLLSGIIGHRVGKEMKKKFGRIVDKKIAERGKVILGDGIAAAKRVTLDSSISKIILFLLINLTTFIHISLLYLLPFSMKKQATT